jgi:uncharacterized protein (DUF1499 family)
MTYFITFKSLKRSPKPNTCLAAPADYCLAAEADFAPPVFPTSADALYQRLQDVISQQKRTTIVKADPATHQVRYIAKTPLIGFKDDIDIEVIPVDENNTTLAIYSRSRVGYSDLGANRKRVEELIAQLTAN